ncbi:hypothetical protein ABIA06_002075 [Bradyrhizobium yuanmingense]|uniref:hypothetical protein n=1 Tax=Bradyrhizobium yuanmingense TaxID=108015 RepID=UPI0035111ED0
MAEIWTPEDFLAQASVPLAAKDFWDPELRATELIGSFAGASSHQIAYPQPVGLEESLGGGTDDKHIVRAQSFLGTLDPWEQVEAAPARGPRARLYAGFDFWDPSPAAESRSVERHLVDDWSALISFPVYDPEAAEHPFIGFFSEERQETHPEKRARWLLSMLGVNGHTRYRFYLRTFTDIFVEYPHHSTFRTLSDFALEDIDVDDIISAFVLRQAWTDFPLFSSVRNRRRELFVASDRSSLLGWKHALELVSHSRGVPPEQIITPDWYDDWLNLPYADPLYWRFVDYIDARFASVEAGALDITPTNRRSVSPIKEISIDGFSLFNNFSRTSQLLRGHTDSWEYSYHAPTTSDNSENVDIIDG